MSRSKAPSSSIPRSKRQPALTLVGDAAPDHGVWIPVSGGCQRTSRHRVSSERGPAWYKAARIR